MLILSNYSTCFEMLIARNYLLFTIIFFLTLLISCMPTTKSPKLVLGVSKEIAEARKLILSHINYQLVFSIPAKVDERIKSQLTINFDLADKSKRLLLDFTPRRDHLLSLEVNGVPQTIRHEDEHIIIDPYTLKKGANQVKIDFWAGETSLNRNEEYLYTLLVPDRASTVFPCFDQPDLKATYRLRLEVPASWEALGNAELDKMIVSEGRKTYFFKASDLISTYVFSFVAGEFSIVEKETSYGVMRMFHRETDTAKVARNVEAIFQQHIEALSWLENYTRIDYPFQKFDFALIPSFQYGGMEHVGAIQYRSSSLLLETSATGREKLNRASLIAHETAHVWFGNLVTMNWFNDVWMKEVFANFMANKIVNKNFPETNHDLNFLLQHYPSSYSVDRTAGANPVRQPLDNLKLAGTIYGAIIYHKAPIAMKQLELVLGEKLFQKGLIQYLKTYAYDNASWSDLIAILDGLSQDDLTAWEEVWINQAGRPLFEYDDITASLTQHDPLGRGLVWPQTFSVVSGGVEKNIAINSYDTKLKFSKIDLFNANGIGYGVLPVRASLVEEVFEIEEPLQRGSVIISLYENMLEGRTLRPKDFIQMASEGASVESSPLIISRLMGYLHQVFWTLLSPTEREEISQDLENSLRKGFENQASQDLKHPVFSTYYRLALSKEALEYLYLMWKNKEAPSNLILSSNDYANLAMELALKIPDRYEEIIHTQLERIENPERKARFEFISKGVSPKKSVRDSAFISLEKAQNRAKEPWVASLLLYLHHPLRQETAVHYLEKSLLWLDDIQRTGDIFFPKRWLDATFSSYQSAKAISIIDDFLKQNPTYSTHLTSKILQASDHLKRANRIVYQL